MNYDKITTYLFELGHLKRIKHEGWRLIGVDNPESVAEHSLRATQIGFILAKLENFSDPHLVTTMVAFHDVGETRIGDIHLVAKKYLKTKELEVVKDQLNGLDIVNSDILKMWIDVEESTSMAGIIAKDADLIEQALTAKEYSEKGFSKANEWIKNISSELKTKSAKTILTHIKKKSSTDWWQLLNYSKKST